MPKGNRLRHFSQTIFNFSMMGINFLVPIIAMLLLTVYLYMICFSAGMTETLYFTCSECVVPLFGSWWAIHLMRPIVEDSGNEIYYSYSVSKMYLGVIRVFEGWVAYCLLTFVYCLLLRLMTPYDFWSYLIQLIFQSLFYFGLGFLSMSITRKALYSWILSLVYGLFYLYTGNKYMPVFSIYTFSEEPLMLNDLFQMLIMRIFAFSLLMIICAQILFSIRGFDGTLYYRIHKLHLNTQKE